MNKKKVIIPVVAAMGLSGCGLLNYFNKEVVEPMPDESENENTITIDDTEAIRQAIKDQTQTKIADKKTDKITVKDDITVPVGTTEQELLALISVNGERLSNVAGVSAEVNGFDTSRSGSVNANVTIKGNNSTSTVSVPVKVSDDTPNIVVKGDKTAPVITAYDLSVEFGYKADFSDFIANDETDGKLAVSVIGNYDSRKAGVYPMTAIATDKSGNSASVRFNLTVNPHPRQGELDSANIKVDELSEVLANAIKDLNKAEGDLELLETELENLNTLSTNANASLETAKSEKAELETKLANAQANLKNAKANYDTAVERATSSPEFLEAKETLDKATEEYMLSLSNKVLAEEEVANAQETLEDAQNTLTEKEEVLEIKQANKADADQKVLDANKAVADAEAVLNDANSDKAEAQREYDAALVAYNSALNNQTNAEIELADANKALEKAEQNIANARAEVEKANELVAQVEAQIAKGSLGFFEWHDEDEWAEDLINYILEAQEDPANSSDLIGKTNGFGELNRTFVGQEGDATSLELMKQSLEMIKKGNELRAKDEHNSGDNEKPLMVNDALMALAQVEANVASTITAHWYGLEGTQFKRTGENLAWYGKNVNPYVGWYNQEKRVYDYYLEHPNATYQEAVEALGTKDLQVGHYKNIANPDNDDLHNYDVTGFAISYHEDRSTGYWGGATYAQEFGRSSYGMASKGKKYTVEEYIEDFNRYYDEIQRNLKSAQDAQQLADEVLSEFIENGGITRTERNRINNAESNLENAKNTVSNKKEALDEKDQNLETATQSVIDAENVLEDKENARDNALENQANAETEVQNAQSDVNVQAASVEEARDSLEDAETNLANIEQEIIDNKEAMDSAQETINTMNEEVAVANAQVQQATENVANVQTEVATAQNNINEIEQEIAEIVNNAIAVEDSIATQQYVVEEKTEAVNTAQENYDNAVEERDAIEDDINTVYTIELGD